MNHVLAGLALLGAALLTMSSCGGAECSDSADCSSGANPEAMAAACADHAAQFCAKRHDCQGAEFLRGGGGNESVESCTHQLTTTCLVATGLPDTQVTPENLAACTSAMKSSGCETLYREPECILPGARAPGAPCLHKYQCQSGNCGGVPSFTPYIDWLCGTCGATEGTPCESGDCGAGLFCSLESSTCVPKGKEGDACSGNPECGGILGCIGGTCQMGPDAGQPCAGGDCNSRRSLLCNTDTSTCERGPIVGLGETCGKMANGLWAMCDIDLRCNEAMQCEAFAGEGEACSTAGPWCDYPSYCQSGSCRRYLLAGEACGASDAQCLSPATCEEGICKVKDECP